MINGAILRTLLSVITLILVAAKAVGDEVTVSNAWKAFWQNKSSGSSTPEAKWTDPDVRSRLLVQGFDKVLQTLKTVNGGKDLCLKNNEAGSVKYSDFFKKGDGE